jgi:hypothetical protein
MSKAIEIKAPHKINYVDGYISVFLGGSIEMGKAIDWQKNVVNELKDHPFIFLNPRRDGWDSTWEQKITNPNFKEQVLWELNALESADVILMYFDPNTTSPISLLELGLHAKSRKLIVYCPDGFYRKGNVDITAEKYGITMVNSFDDIFRILKQIL